MCEVRGKHPSGTRKADRDGLTRFVSYSVCCVPGFSRGGGGVVTRSFLLNLQWFACADKSTGGRHRCREERRWNGTGIGAVSGAGLTKQKGNLERLGGSSLPGCMPEVRSIFHGAFLALLCVICNGALF